MVQRFIGTLEAYAQLMSARYKFSATHKLPGSKGRLREDAVVEFLMAFLPVNHTVATNVFVTTDQGDEYPREIDVVVHDSNLGGLWQLDTFGANSICNLEGVKVVMEVKSNLDEKELEDAKKKAVELRKFAEDRRIAPPAFILFCFGIAPENQSSRWMGLDTIKEQALHAALPFDLTICPEEFCYVSDRHDEFALGFDRGLSASDAEEDGSVQDKIISLRYADSRYSRKFIDLGSTAGERLLGLAAFVSDRSGNGKHTSALLSSAIRPRRNPIFPGAD